MTDPEPPPPNSPKPQTDERAENTVFRGVGQVVMHSPTFSQHNGSSKVVDPIRANIIAEYIPHWQTLLLGLMA